MKKIISSVLAVSIFASGFFIDSGLTSTTRANASDAPLVSSITDLSQYPANDVIVVYKKDSNATKKKTLKICSLEESQEEQATISSLTSNSVILKLDSEDALEQAVTTLSSDPRVAYVQPNYIYKILDTETKTPLEQLQENASFCEQWAYYNDGTLTYKEEDYRTESNSFLQPPNFNTNTSSIFTVTATSDIDIQLPEALQVCPTSFRETIVAIIDTGIQYNHPELENAIWVNSGEVAGDGIDNDANGYIDDVHGWNFFDESVAYETGWLEWNKQNPGSSSTTSSNGNNQYYNPNSTIEDAHGTHCAGTIAAANNTIGTVGIASNANVKLMIVKALGGDEGYGTTESVVKGIQYAEENGAKICNLSLGGEEDDTMLRNSIQNSSMLFTIAAGNGDANYEAIDIDKHPTYPACYEYENVLAVANLQCDGTLHYTSNYGSVYVDLAAPGSNIYSTSTDNAGYEYMTGTSMSAPMVAGVAALLYSCYEDYSIADICNAILSSTTSLDSLSGKCATEGMLNAAKAAEYLNNYTPKATPTQVPATEVPTVTSTPVATSTTSQTTGNLTGTTNTTSVPSGNETTTNTSPLVIENLVISEDDILMPNRTILLLANTKNGSGTIQYHFSVSKNGNTKTISDFSTSSFTNWTPTSAGTYKLTVTARDSQNITAILTKTVQIKKTKVSSLKWNKQPKQGKNITLSAKLNISESDVMYSFSIKNKAGKKIFSKTTSKNKVQWKVKKKDTYKITVTVKDIYGNTAKKTITCKVTK